MAAHSGILALGLALGSPIFPSGCEGKLGVALESLQGRAKGRRSARLLGRPAAAASVSGPIGLIMVFKK